MYGNGYYIGAIDDCNCLFGFQQLLRINDAKPTNNLFNYSTCMSVMVSFIGRYAYNVLLKFFIYMCVLVVLKGIRFLER